MISQRDLGRYEYRGGSSCKFWHIYYDSSTGTHTCEWGRIGNPAQGRKTGLNDAQASKKVREKLNKGYSHAGGFKSIDTQGLARDFNASDYEEQTDEMLEGGTRLVTLED